MGQVIAASLVMQIGAAISGLAAADTATPRADLSGVRSWGYQLQQVDPAQVAASSYDLVTIDYSRDGSRDGVFSAADVAQMQVKPDGGHRIVLAYLSIGEAEDYRAYWHREWSANPPSWLGSENPDWPANYAVRYWDAQWQSLIFGAPGAYLDAIIAAGFDGIYIDRVDGFDVRDQLLTRPQRMNAMSKFVADLVAYARGKVPGFVVVGQNAEELLGDAVYAQAIDAIAKEDLFFGLAGDGVPNQKAQLRASLAPIQKFQASGRPVFVVEYLDAPDAIAVAHQQSLALRAPLFIGDRELDDVNSR